MSSLNLNRQNERYEIRLKDVPLEYKEQFFIHTKIEKIQSLLPDECDITLHIVKNEQFQAQLFIRGSVLGFNLKTSSVNLTTLIEKIFDFADEEIRKWGQSSSNNNVFAPYFGGYPSYYAEQTY
jgi:hypothetical protein